ncbi:MAG: RdgB/HAM1 family non-canonical purine NTP pyrophosphatase [Planctomycetaceae bacterium]|nr:RdgB/HAM1 family non-canonical purine NTP pyrophosphatase [Planctomycetaceae bacterium]
MTPDDFPLLVLASRNAKKAAEIDALLEPHGIRVKSIADFQDASEVIEDGSSFKENASKKASQTAAEIGHWTIGEDSGICVDALGGDPGIYSARFSGEEATDTSNNALLIEKLAGLPAHKRSAHYVCHIALSDPQGMIQLNVQRRCNGRIIEEPRGANGFGYDPYFLIPEYNRTFGELSPVVKKCISHRARAFTEFIPQLLTKLKSLS